VTVTSSAVLAPEHSARRVTTATKFRGPHGMTSTWSVNLYGGLAAEPPAVSRGRGRSPPEAESFQALGCPKEKVHLPLL